MATLLLTTVCTRLGIDFGGNCGSILVWNRVVNGPGTSFSYFSSHNQMILVDEILEVQHPDAFNTQPGCYFRPSMKKTICMGAYAALKSIYTIKHWCCLYTTAICKIYRQWCRIMPDFNAVISYSGSWGSNNDFWLCPVCTEILPVLQIIWWSNAM